VKYVKNGKTYDVGPMGFTLDDLERLKVRYEVGRQGGLFESSHGISIDTVRFDL